MNLTDVCIRRPVVAWMIMAAVLMFGGFGLWRIGISELPDVDFPVVNVVVTWQGAAPEVMEHEVLDVLEDAVSQVQGITAITGRASQGAASVLIELDVNRSVDAALTDVQAKISQAQVLLPKDIDPPIIQKFNPEDFPFMWLSLSGPFSRQELADAMKYRVEERLQLVPGVGNIEVGSRVDRSIRLWFDAAKLEARNLTANEVIAALKREHLELPAGRLTTASREVNVRILGEAADLPSLRRLVIGGSATQPVRLSDVALVEDGFEDVRSLFRNSGVDAQAIGVKKQRGENAVAVAARVHTELTAIRKMLPAGMALAVNYDATVFIGKAVRDVEHELMLAIVLTSLVCFLFLGSWSATVNVVLAIPMSILGTVFVLYVCGFTLNTFTLLALALVVGIVVDDAIMVQENISRLRSLGLSAVDAASKGTRQIAFAALASSVAVIAIFAPVGLVPGVIGKFFAQFAVALCVAVAFSYLEAVTLAPARCAQFMAIGTGRATNRFARWSERMFSRLIERYLIALRWAVARPWLTLGVAAALFIGSFWFLAVMPKELTPSQDQGSLLVRLETTPMASLAECDHIVRQTETWLNTQAEVLHSFAIIGGFGGTGVNTAVMFVTLTPKEARSVSHLTVMERMRVEFNRYPGCKATIEDLSKGGFAPGRNYPVDFSLRGNDWPALVATAQSLAEQLRSPTVLSPPAHAWYEFWKRKTAVAPAAVFADVDTDYQLGKPELVIVPDRDRAHDLGVRTDDVATAINALLGGIKIGKFTSGQRRIDVRANLRTDDRLRPEDLASSKIRAADGRLVPLSQLVTMRERGVLQSIAHRDHARAISVFANLKDGHGESEAGQLISELTAKLPDDVFLVQQGASKQTADAGIAFLVTFVMGLVFAYMVLAMQFNSLTNPITVMVIMPLALTGAAASLWLGGFSLNTYSVIGVLLLMGLVKKNSIILVDYANQARRGIDGQIAVTSAEAAMLSAGRIRLRPILMTSAATVMAAVPTGLGLGAGAEVRQPMAVAILGGVFVSTVLSLLVVPAFYVLADRFSRRVSGWFGRHTTTPADADGASAA